jgi:hypothetical protein
MKITIDIATLGIKQLWNHCNERYDIMGLVCKEAGLQDDDMDHRTCVILKKDLKEEMNSRDLPAKLSPFFVQEKNWNPVSQSYKGSLKFNLSELGMRIISLNDSLLTSPEDWYVEGEGGWKAQVATALSDGGVDVEWKGCEL